MTLSEKQKYIQQYESLIYQLANLMLNTVKVTLETLDDYAQFLDEDPNQNALEDIPF